MAGAFGYEREHFAVSMQIGELVLFPAIRSQSGETIIAAPGTSCRHQIHDGTQRTALHPAQILHAALRGRSGMPSKSRAPEAITQLASDANLLSKSS
jgi:Fe-S oxidoreductase